MLLALAMRLAFFLSRHTPLALRYRLGSLGAEAIYWCWPTKRHNTRRNMAVVLGTLPNDRRAAALARASFRNYGRYIVDFLNMTNLPPEDVAGQTHVTGWEHVDHVLEAGHGAIFVTGHYGLWDYAPGVLAQRYPGRVYIVVEAFESEHMDSLVQGQRGLRGINIIQMTAVRQMVRALRNNGILALLVDRPVHGDGVPVEFFGRRTMVPGGAATLAAMTGAGLLPGCFVHREDGGYTGLILPAVENPRSGDRATDVCRMTQSTFTAVERIISENPTHWYMFRDMWATVPEALIQQSGASV